MKIKEKKKIITKGNQKTDLRDEQAAALHVIKLILDDQLEFFNFCLEFN
jgi:hypothetical protein